jgi:hypothetical protein
MALIFNLFTYRQILIGAKRAGYRFIDFSSLDDAGMPTLRGLNLCLLRHDVDAELTAALTMAEVESELGISSTYFLMLRSPIYNLMSRHNHITVEKILKLGHAIGLHYDQGFDLQRGLTPAQTAIAIDREAQWLESQFNTQVTTVSFHQPGSAVLQGEISTGIRINTYDRSRLADFDYFSDSNRQFLLAQLTDGGITEAVAAYAPRNLQLLIHPIWWVYEDSSTEAVWDRVIHSNLQAMQQQLLETERAYGSIRQIEISKKDAL